MGANSVTEDASIWPTSIKGGSIQKAIERFCELADDPTHEGSVSFSNLFTSTGTLVARGHVCKGHDGESAPLTSVTSSKSSTADLWVKFCSFQDLVRFRDGAWDPITKRKHTVHKVYVSHDTRADVLVLGRVTFGHKNGQSVTQDFQGNFLMIEDGNTALIQSYQAWLVSPRLLRVVLFYLERSQAHLD